MPLKRVQADHHDHVDQRLDGAGLERRAGEGRDEDRGRRRRSRTGRPPGRTACARTSTLHQTLVACREMRPCGRSEEDRDHAEVGERRRVARPVDRQRRLQDRSATRRAGSRRWPRRRASRGRPARRRRTRSAPGWRPCRRTPSRSSRRTGRRSRPPARRSARTPREITTLARTPTRPAMRKSSVEARRWMPSIVLRRISVSAEDQADRRDGRHDVEPRDADVADLELVGEERDRRHGLGDRARRSRAPPAAGRWRARTT